MKRKVWGMFLSLALSLAYPALGSKGVVVDSNKRPVPFARIAVLGQPGWVVADAQGQFQISDTLTPPFTLVITGSDGVLLGSFTFTQAVQPLVLQLQSYEEQVAVTAVRSPDLVVAPATAFSTVSQQALELRSPAQLIDVLAVVPNLGRVGGDHSAVPAIRGLARFRSLLLVDGTRVLTERRVGPSATFLDPLSLGEVEVVRGAAGVAYGSDAFGGVIATRTRLAVPGQPWQLRYAVLGATGAPEQSALLEAGGALGTGALTFGVGTRDFARYASPAGDVFNSEATFHSVRIGYQLPLRRGVLRLLWRSDMGRDIGRTSVTSQQDRTTYPEENSHRLILAFEGQLPPPWTRSAWHVSWVEYQLITERDQAATDAKPRRLTRADVFAHDYNARFEAEQPLAGGKLLLGAEGYGRIGLSATNDRYQFQGAEPSRTREVSIKSARKDDFGLFATYNRSFSLVTATLGLRADASRAINSGGYFGNKSLSFTRASGFAGATLRPTTNLDFTVQFSRGFRDAVLSDRFYRGITGRGFITGNPDLKPEMSQQWDFALRYSERHWRFGLYAYNYEIDDFIERYKAQGNYFFRNRGKARLKGLECELSLNPAANLNVQLGLQYPQGKVVDDRTYMDDIPARGGFFLLSLTQGRLFWETRLAAYARDNRPGPTEQMVPGYAVLDLGGRYQFSKELELGFYVRNLLDHAYLSSSDSGAVLAPGRSLQLSLRGVLEL